MKTATPYAKTPPLLSPGDKVAIVAPSCWAERAWVEGFARKLEQWGLPCFVHPQCFLQQGVLAGSDAARAEALMELFTDPAIKGIFCARGGNGAVLVLDRLDYALIAQNPKVFVGFSDATVLLNAITARAGFATFHGPMARNFSPEKADERTENALFSMVMAGAREPVLLLPELDVDCEGQAEGRLVGGNLSLLQTLIGTPYDWSGQDAILFFEEIEEPFYKIDRALAQLRMAGKFDHVRAVLVGEMVGLLDEKPDLDPAEHRYYGQSLKDIVRKHVPPEVPLAFGVPCGHGRHLMTFPIGARARVKVQKGQSAMTVFL